MLLDPSDWSLDQAFDEVRKGSEPEARGPTQRRNPRLDDRVRDRAESDGRRGAARTDGIRAALAAELATLDRAAAGSGTHPFVTWEETRLSKEERYRYLHRSMRELVHREPTFAMHVHVAIGDPELAIGATVCGCTCRCCSRFPRTRPWQGRDSGIASIRTPIFGTFPRSGIPRRFDDYAQYTEALDTLIACGAFPDPGFVWWDLRLQPTLGTVEMRVMDTQPETWRAGALIALTQSLTRLEALEETAPASLVDAPELLEENRFRAARDGAGAELLDPRARCAHAGRGARRARGRRLPPARARARLRAPPRRGAAPDRRARGHAPARAGRRPTTTSRAWSRSSARASAVRRAQPPIDRPSAAAPLRDRGDDQRLADAGVAGRIDAGARAGKRSSRRRFRAGRALRPSAATTSSWADGRKPFLISTSSAWSLKTPPRTASSVRDEDPITRRPRSVATRPLPARPVT